MKTAIGEPRLLAELEEAAPAAVSVQVDLAKLSRWRIGGPAEVLVEPSDEAEAIAVMQVLRRTGVSYCVIGETSNLLFDTAGFNGVIIRIASRMAGIDIKHERVVTKAGTSVPQLARAVGSRGLSGLEHIVGIPGTIGGLVLMNGGSQRKGIGTNVTRIQLLTADATVRTLSRDECKFAYRSSQLQELNGVVLEVELSLSHGSIQRINAEMDEIVASRRTRFPEHEPNGGSTFLSDPKMYEGVGPPGLVIEQAGFKGLRVGGAQVSPDHANFINNVGGATSDDVLELIAQIRDTVRNRTGFTMDTEVRYVSPDGTVRPAHQEADMRTTPNSSRFGLSAT